MHSQDIRRRFLNYFKQKNHAIIGSSPVVPHDDPTLLFNNAGMNQFKDVFLGKSQREYKRAATAQKCIRVGGKHNDLDNVGHTSRHLTFFEMLGNFSFGDYFKKEAIEYAFEVSTQVFGFSPEQFWITVYRDDDEAFELWQRFMPKERILRFDEKDNFWSMGDTGPCGPCSELYFDRGSRYGSARNPAEDASGERYLEFWNLVFMQFNRSSTGELSPLPKQSIDTGAGLERVVSLKMGVDNLFETDILRSLVAQVEQVSGRKYHPKDLVLAPAYHVIADHIRSLAFAIADGAQPSNVERGYVLRKLLRRAVRYGKILGLNDPFLAKILPRLNELMGADYPELLSAESRIAEILSLEEESFIRTLKKGGNILSSVIEKSHQNPLKQISGEEAFKLKDTYGFPLEEILLIAKDSGLSVNLDSYQLLEEQAKEKSRTAHVTHAQEIQESLFTDFVSKHGPCQFVGYETLMEEATVLAIVVDGKFKKSLEEGQEGFILLNKTPFYAEKGGQVGDVGTISHHRACFKVSDCHSPYNDVIVHLGKLEQGTLLVGEPVVAKVDEKRRQNIANHHTATHLLHWALHKILGSHIRQAGSLVETDRLRFDFNHHKALTHEEIRQIEELVNEKIRENSSVKAYELSYDEAQKRSDIKQFFGEKYGSKVRVIDIEFSKELCGGTHTDHLGTIGLFRVQKEGSVAAGVRRIEAVVGEAALAFMYEQEHFGIEASHLLKTSLSKLPEKISSLVEQNRQMNQELKHAKKQMIKQLAHELMESSSSIQFFAFISAVVDLDIEGMQLLAEEIFKAKPSLVLLLASKAAGRCQLFARVSSDLVQKGVHAGQLIKEIAGAVGGSGGGKAELAQAGGKEPQGVEKALEMAKNYLYQLS